MGACCGDNEEYHTATKQEKWNNQPCLVCEEILLDKEIWNNIPRHRGTCDVCPHDDDKIWRMAITKIERVTPEEIREIKNNPPEPIKLDWDTEPVINSLEPEEFYEHYQNLALTREKQEQWLAQLNTRLCCHCLIFSDFEYCDDCDLIYNPPPCMIYMIPEKKEPISSCTSELESSFNSDSNFNNNDDENNGSSFIQNGNDNDNNINSDSNSDSNYEQYIALLDLTKEQKLKWFSNNNEGIMPEHVHDTDARFDLRYPGKDAIKLESYLHTCIDLKIALEISATTMV
ncbi:hypothetical protein G9A89_003060 [Geosiphon pyriformis]|nr:hypothetical protein G9A89_003060 [Geosiphon pyriformis]